MLYQTPKPYVALGTQENFYGTGVPMMSMRQLSKLLIVFHGHHDDDVQLELIGIQDSAFSHLIPIDDLLPGNWT